MGRAGGGRPAQPRWDTCAGTATGRRPRRVSAARPGAALRRAPPAPSAAADGPFTVLRATQHRAAQHAAGSGTALRGGGRNATKRPYLCPAPAERSSSLTASDALSTRIEPKSKNPSPRRTPSRAPRRHDAPSRPGLTFARRSRSVPAARVAERSPSARYRRDGSVRLGSVRPARLGDGRSASRRAVRCRVQTPRSGRLPPASRLACRVRLGASPRSASPPRPREAPLLAAEGAENRRGGGNRATSGLLLPRPRAPRRRASLHLGDGLPPRAPPVPGAGGAAPRPDPAALPPLAAAGRGPGALSQPLLAPPPLAPRPRTRPRARRGGARPPSRAGGRGSPRASR